MIAARYPAGLAGLSGTQQPPTFQVATTQRLASTGSETRITTGAPNTAARRPIAVASASERRSASA
jgi:hypothetical protein